MCLLRTRIPSYVTQTIITHKKLQADTTLSNIKPIFGFPQVAPPKYSSWLFLNPILDEAHPSLVSITPPRSSKVSVTSLPNLKGPSLASAGAHPGLCPLGLWGHRAFGFLPPCSFSFNNQSSECWGLQTLHTGPLLLGSQMGSFRPWFQYQLYSDAIHIFSTQGPTAPNGLPNSELMYPLPSQHQPGTCHRRLRLNNMSTGRFWCLPFLPISVTASHIAHHLFG